MSPRFSFESRNSKDHFPAAILGFLINVGKRLGLIASAAITGVTIWLGCPARTDKTMDPTRPDAAVSRRLPEGRHKDPFHQPRNLHGRVIMILSFDHDESIWGIFRALELLRMKPEDATPRKIAEWLEVPVEEVNPDRPLVELLVAEVDPQVKARLIAALGTASATPGEIQAAARTLGIDHKRILTIPQRIPLTLRMFQRGIPDEEVRTVFEATKAYARNWVPDSGFPMPANQTERLAIVPLAGKPVYPEINVRFLQPGSLPLSVRKDEARP
jgi:hypothetical protein